MKNKNKNIKIVNYLLVKSNTASMESLLTVGAHHAQSITGVVLIANTVHVQCTLCTLCTHSPCLDLRIAGSVTNVIAMSVSTLGLAAVVSFCQLSLIND